MPNVATLRPTFFRFGDGRAFAGWITPEGDLWAHQDTLPDIIETLRVEGYKMLACEFALAKPHPHNLRLMSRAEQAFTTGEVLEFSEACEHYDQIEAGEQCVSVRPNEHSGTVQLFMTEYHLNLEDQSNTITLVPHECDEVLALIRLRAKSRAVISREPVAIPALNSTSIPIAPVATVALG